MFDLQQIVKRYTKSQEVIPGQVLLLENYLDKAEASVIQTQLMREIDWQSEQLKIYGKQITVPRLMSWHGDKGSHYRYSSVDHEPLAWTKTLTKLRDKLTEDIACSFNSVLLNLYRDGQDSMGWHSDDEPELGEQPVIASVSLGQERRFHFRMKNATRQTIKINLPAGSLLLMFGHCQQQWQHQLPKTSKKIPARINLTFRQIKTDFA